MGCKTLHSRTAFIHVKTVRLIFISRRYKIKDTHTQLHRHNRQNEISLGGHAGAAAHPGQAPHRLLYRKTSRRKNAGCNQSAVRQPCHPPEYSERNVNRNGKIVYPEGSRRTAGNQHHNSGCGKEQRSHRLCAVCSQWLRFLYQRQSPGIRCQMYAQSKAYGEENDLPQCAEGPSARLMPNYLRPPFHSFLH